MLWGRFVGSVQCGNQALVQEWRFHEHTRTMMQINDLVGTISCMLLCIMYDNCVALTSALQTWRRVIWCERVPGVCPTFVFYEGIASDGSHTSAHMVSGLHDV